MPFILEKYHIDPLNDVVKTHIKHVNNKKVETNQINNHFLTD
jgi:hypothetical protein